MQLEETGNPYERVDQEGVSFDDVPSNEDALKIVVQNAERTEQWLTSKQQVLRWKESQMLYDSYTTPKSWDAQGQMPRANVKVYTVAQHVQSILPQIMNGLFSDDPPFMIQPRYGTSQDTCRAVGELLHFQMEDCGFKQELEIGLQSAITFGTGIFKWGWDSYNKKRAVYKRAASPVTLGSDIPGAPPTEINTKESDVIERDMIDEQVDRPVFESIDLHHIYVDPKLRKPDIRLARFVIQRQKLTGAELDALRDFEGYHIPSKEKLMALLFPPSEDAPISRLENLQQPNSTANMQAVSRDITMNVDPTEDDKFELLEYWTNDEVIMVLNRKLVIRNERNPFGKLPFSSINWWNVSNAFYGLGLGHTIGYEQVIQKGLIDGRLDQVALNLNRGFIRKRSKNIPMQNIRLRPNGIYEMDELNDLKPMDKIEAVGEGFVEVQASEARAEAVSGANEQMVQGNTPDKGRTSLGRTATGANLLAGGSQSRMEAFVERIGDQVFEPALDAFHEMNAALLPPSTMQRILSQELQTAYTVDTMDIINARLVFDILAAARMQQRRTMSQNLPFLFQQLLTAPVQEMLQVQGMKVDINELVNMLFDVSGWKNKASIIVPMNDDDKQRLAAQQSTVQQQMQATAAKIEGEKNAKLEINDANNSAKAVNEILRHGLEQQMEGQGSIS